MEGHLVTGATGFVGAALVLELLERTDDPVYAMVRPGEQSARARLTDAITHAARVYRSRLDPSALDRCRVIPGDLLQPGCGVELSEPVSHVWHCAASLRYENRFEDEIRATNTQGTRHVLELAERLGARVFNYTSTAYVAGRRTGAIREEPVDPPANNHYEHSKIDAERVVADSRLQVRIFRPSVVVGHSRTLAATTFSGFYGFVRQLAQFRGMVHRTQQGLLERTSLRIRLDPEAGIHLVPVDAVVSEMAQIGLTDHASGIYHLTTRAPPTVGLAMRSVFALLELREPEFVDSSDAFEWLDSRFDERLDFFGSYIRGDKRFDRRRTDAALGAVGPETFYDRPALDALGRWYLGVLEQERRALPVAR